MAVAGLRALGRAHTYSPLTNGFAAVGALSGLCVLAIGFLMCVTMMGGDIARVATVYVTDPVHLAFLSVPLLLMIAFGAAGTVQRDRAREIHRLAERVNRLREETDRVQASVQLAIAAHLRRVRETLAERKTDEDEEARLSRERIEGARDIVAQAALIVTHARSGIEVVREALRNVGPMVPGLDPIWAERLLHTMNELHREASRLLGEPVEIKAGS